MSVAHDSDPKLACTLFANDGTELRFGPDEADAANVVTDVSFGTQVPGWGFAEGSVKLNRPFALDSLDANLFASAKVYDESGQTVYRGRVAKINRSGSEIELDLEGPLAHLDDDPTVRVIYRDTDLGSWQGPSNTAQLSIYSAAIDVIQDFSVENDSTTGLPTLRLPADGRWAVGVESDAVYDAGPGLTLSTVAFTYAARNLAAGYTGRIFGADNVDRLNLVVGTDVVVGATSAGTWVETAVAGKRAAHFQLFLGPSASTTDTDRELRITNLAVYGNHGLTKRGSEPDAGFYASDIVQHALGYAPLIDTAPGGIEASSFVIPHLAFRDYTTPRAIIEAVSVYGASGFQPPDWGYYEDGFFWRSPGSYGRTWRLRRDEGLISVDEGPATETRCNGFVVTYSDAAGQTHTVGPTDSGADYETDLLADTDPANPVNSSGIPRRYGSREIGITKQDGAVLIGQLLLRDANRRRYSGSAELKGRVADEAGNRWPAYMVRAGDYVIVEDDEDTEPRKIVATTYSAGTTTATLDNKAASIDVALERLAVASKPAGF